MLDAYAEPTVLSTGYGSNASLPTLRAWSIFRHSPGFLPVPTFSDSNTRSILGRPFETRNESQGRQSIPPRYPLCLKAKPAWSPNRLGTHPSLASISAHEKSPNFLDFPDSGRLPRPVTPKPHRQKNHMFSIEPPCLFLKRMFEFQAFV